MPLPAGVHPLPFRTDLGSGETTLTPLAIELETGVLLVDVGLPESFDTIMDHLADIGMSPADIRMIVLTHQDVDHAAGLSQLVDVADPVVLAHPRDSPAIDGREDPRAIPGDERYPAARVDVEVQDGAVINTSLGPARVVATPGHTPGHISLYLPAERFLIAGDALIHTADRLLPPKADFSMDPATAYASIGTLASLDIEHVFCYHGGYSEAGSERLHALVESLGSRQQ